LLVKFLEDLKSGNKIRFHGAVVSDKGVIIRKKKIFSSSPDFISWQNVSLWQSASILNVGIAGIKNPLSIIHYFYENNVKVLEKAFELFKENGKDRLSDVLDLVKTKI
jgi:hypothetical protein